MKKLFTLLLVLVTGVSFAQSPNDTIILYSNDTILAEIKKNGLESVEYVALGESMINEISKESIKEIIFSNGKRERCHANIKTWENVIVTENPEDVKGLTDLGHVYGWSGWGAKKVEKGKKQAMQDLKQHVIDAGGWIVLITDKRDLPDNTKWKGTNYDGRAYK